MGKALELVGFALIGGTVYAFLGMGDSELRWPVFWSCAGGALAIIIYRKKRAGAGRPDRAGGGDQGRPPTDL